MFVVKTGKKKEKEKRNSYSCYVDKKDMSVSTVLLPSNRF